MPTDIRGAHPYHMYDEIRLQPEAIARSLALVEQGGSRAVEAFAGASRIWVTGCGTSFHGALGGAWFLRSFTNGRLDARAIEAYELVTYHAHLVRPADVVVAITHSGTSVMTNNTVGLARERGAISVLVTGFSDTEVASQASLVVQTGYAEERSWAHTISYTAALASLAALANRLADDDRRLDLTALPELVSDVLNLEPIAHRMAASAAVADAQMPLVVVLLGGGPHAATAAEGALKLLETSYIRAIPFEIEQILHGPLAAVSPGNPVILVAPTGRSTERAVDAYRALLQLGVVPMVVAGESSADRYPDAHRLVLPELPEVLSPIPSVVPLQLFSYYLSTSKGLNPDLIHRDDERQRAARDQYS